jgi:hypothetical protein
MYLRPEAGPSFVLVGTWAGSRRAGVRLELKVPGIAIPEYVPDPLVRLSFRFDARRGGDAFLEAPCPGTYLATAYYFDGSVVKSSDRAGCG